MLVEFRHSHLRIFQLFRPVALEERAPCGVRVYDIVVVNNRGFLLNQRGRPQVLPLPCVLSSH